MTFITQTSRIDDYLFLPEVIECYVVVPAKRQLLLSEILEIQGTLDIEGTVVLI